MKFLNKLLLVALLATIFASCGSDDEPAPPPPPKPVPQELTVTHTITIPLQGFASSPQASSAGKTVLLKDIVGDSVANNIVAATTELKPVFSYIIVRGLAVASDTMHLNQFQVKVGNRSPKVWGSCSAIAATDFRSDMTHQGTMFMEVINNIFSDLVNTKKADVVTTFFPTMDISTATKPVFLDIVFQGRYIYNTYPGGNQ